MQWLLSTVMLVEPPAGVEPRPYEGTTEVVAVEPAPARTATEEVKEPDWERGASREASVPVHDKTWTVGAFVDTAYAFNSNFPDNHLNRGSVTVPRTEEATVQLGAAYLFHPATEEEPWRFELALQAGPAADALYVAEPITGGDAGAFAGQEVFKHFAVANAGFAMGLHVPGADGPTNFTGGLMFSPIGFGGSWTKDQWHVTQTWAANATPYYLLGGRIGQPLPLGFEIAAWIVNGAQTASDVNDVPSYVVDLSWNYRDWAATTVLMFGPEDIYDEDAELWRVHGNASLTWNRRRIGVAGEWHVGREKVLPPPPLIAPIDEEVTLWTGGALFVRGRPYDGEHVYLDLGARGDAWWERDARLYETEGWLIGTTATATLGLWDYLMLRLEYRYDHATSPDGFFFQDDAITPDATGLADDQHTAIISLVGMFEYDFATRRRKKRPAAPPEPEVDSQ